MSSEAAVAPRQSTFVARLLPLRFSLRRLWRTAIVLGVSIGGISAIQALGYIMTYTTSAAREKFAASLGSNLGVGILYGKAHQIQTPEGYIAWRCVGVLSIITAIWALLVVTKWLRGQEETGRWEILLVGQTTQRRATHQTLIGIGLTMLMATVISTLIVFATGQSHDLHFSVQESAFLGLTLILGGALFAAVGAVTSQLAATRRRASAMAFGVLGVFFGMRAIGDTVANYEWVRNLSPLGWIENLHPIFDSRPMWLLPIFTFIALCLSYSLVAAGRRDMGDSLLADNDSARPRTKLLSNPFGAAIRLNRAVLLGWIIGITVSVSLISSIAKSAASAVSDSESVSQSLQTLSGSTSDAALLVIGMGFYIGIIALIAMTVSSMGALRNDEANGYLDNFLVQPVARLRWLGGRLALILLAICGIGLAAGIVSWAFATGQHLGIPASKFALAGVNMLAPAIFTLGFTTLCFGFVPRLTSALGYGIIIWSFLLTMIGSVVKMNHWVTDLSLLQHIAYTPAVDPHWASVIALTVIGLCAALIGALRFRSRDLASE
jgi:ABC-2 type transport system permease protein